MKNNTMQYDRTTTNLLPITFIKSSATHRNYQFILTWTGATFYRDWYDGDGNKVFTVGEEFDEIRMEGDTGKLIACQEGKVAKTCKIGLYIKGESMPKPT